MPLSAMLICRKSESAIIPAVTNVLDVQMKGGTPAPSHKQSPKRIRQNPSQGGPDKFFICSSGLR